MQVMAALRAWGRMWLGRHARLAVLAIFTVLIFDSTMAAAAPRFAALTVDARTGKLLFANDVDGLRHPASLTKMMTLYLLFQDLKAGKLKLDSPIRISARAASMAPSRLGAKPGTSITVETAIRALVVKSANDVAAAVAENLGGTEAAFAKRMTRTARAIGMSRSSFVNASGLPNPNQITTARDMATLGLRLMRDFPEYYPYFRTPSFTYAGRTIRTHNRLIGRFEGTDGIKTGYIAASGFNLVSSVRRGDKRLVGVVLGGRSGSARDAYMKKMLAAAFADASGGKAIVALAGSAKGAIETIEAAAPQVAETPPPQKKAAKEAASAPPEAESVGDGGEDGSDDMAEAAANASAETAVPAPQPDQPKVIEAEVGQPTLPDKLPFEVKPEVPQTAADAAVVASLADEGWSIQVGSYATKKDAQAGLQRLKKKSPTILNGKQGFTVQMQKGDKTTFRGRFSGFTEDEAEAACKAIKKQKSECQVLAPAS